MTCTIVTNGKELQSPCQNEEEKPVLAIRQKLLGGLETLIYDGYDEFWFNCEYGVPLWAAEMLSELKKDYALKLHIAVPYEEQTTNWTENQRDRYFRLHQLADSVKLIHHQWCNNCYEDAEKYMLEHSDLLYVFGSQKDNLSAVRMAEAMKISVLFFDDSL
ncbi:MAG: DUF1273 family protein [Oscillospiraceae bacterium]|nr:DUF1273 family protein [Oscillospiraceae bacterium]